MTIQHLGNVGRRRREIEDQLQRTVQKKRRGEEAKISHVCVTWPFELEDVETECGDYVFSRKMRRRRR